MEHLGPLGIALAAGVAALVAWSRWRRDDAFRPVAREAARRMSEAAADQVVREATRRLRPTSLAGAALAWVLLGALGFEGAHVAGFGPGLGGLPTILGGRKTGSTTTPAFQYSAPNTPTILTLTVVDTSTVWVEGSSFSGSGDDTQDSVIVVITRVAQDTTTILASARTSTSTNARDTVSDNTNLKADSTYKAWFKYHAENGGYSAYSAPDTFVNTVAVAGMTVFGHWDWDGSVGTDKAMIMDSSKAVPLNALEGFAIVNGAGCPAFTTFSTSGEGRDYPTTNFIRLKTFDACSGSGTVDGYARVGFDGIRALGVNDSTFIRYYVRVLYPQSYAGSPHSWPRTHGDEWDGDLYNGSPQMPYSPTFNVSPSAATWQWEIRSLPNGCYSAGGYNNYNLSKNTTYRLEHGVIRTGSTTYEARARIYNLSGTLLYDSEDFDRRCWDGQTAQTLANNSFTGNSTTWADAEFFLIGLTGVSNLSTSTDEQDVFEWAGLAICSSWCGAYPISGVED